MTRVARSASLGMIRGLPWARVGHARPPTGQSKGREPSARAINRHVVASWSFSGHIAATSRREGAKSGFGSGDIGGAAPIGLDAWIHSV